MGGILLGRTISNLEAGKITEFIKENELNTESYLIEQDLIELFDRNNCELATVRINDLSNQLTNIGRKLTSKDAKETLGQENYNFLKRKFHLMQIKTYILFKKLKEKCDPSPNIILYYYSINDPDSAKQGHILDRIVKDYNVRIFAIEYNYSKELTFLESHYNIKETPAIVINYGKIFEGLTNYETIQIHIKKSS